MKCITCGAELSKDREDAIIFLGKEHIPTCIEHASDTRKKAIFQGASGVSPLIIVDSLGDDETLYHEKESQELADFSYNMTEE